ncbi:homoserine kinase [Peptoniphilus equinus]|uniref:Homoserine kinase n=1 Tax=Peptoniphilus equinus TaxID=3016343 RepID=A0ABY7QXR5_9FIRM|nr:homoserine kinase [Peptoniphilus equinus]WBW50743.1 homoserine kinase [Peptoniphilus equinus]
MKIRVPGTSANLGAGFDLLGLALSIYNSFEITLKNPGEVQDETDNLVVKAFGYFYAQQGMNPPAIDVRITGDVPVSRGLGSSATCIVAGLMAANELSGLNLSKFELLSMAADLEGHGDNVSAALFGALTMYYQGHLLRKRVSPLLTFYALIPDYIQSTEASRKALSRTLVIEDAVQNMAATVLTIESLVEGDVELLKRLPQDTLHEARRMAKIPGALSIKETLQNQGRVFLSGSGSTLLFIADQSFKNPLVFEGYKVCALSVDEEGAVYEP